MPTIKDIRAQYPQYDDLSDEQLADAMHRKFYSDIPQDEFNARIGMQPKPQAPKPVRQTAPQTSGSNPQAYVKAFSDAANMALGENLRIINAGVQANDAPAAPQAPSGVTSPGAGYGARSRGVVANAPVVRQSAGDFGRALPRGVLPSAASMAGFGAGATAAGTAAAPLEAVPGLGTVAHGAITLGGGIIGAMTAGGATRYVQDKAVDALPTSITAPIGQDKATRERDAARSPYAVLAGELAPSFLFAGPGAGVRVPTVASPAQRIFQSPLAQSAIGASIGGGANAAQQYVTTGKIDPVQAGVAAVVGAAQTRNTRAGEALTNAGARMANYGAGLFGAQRAQYESMAGDFENRHGPNPTFDPAGEPPPNPPSGGWKSVATPEGEILSADGNGPLNFANHKQAARFAVVNALGGSHDIAIVGNRIVLRRRDGSAPPAPMRDTTGDEVSGQLPSTQTEPVAPSTAPEVAAAAPSQTPGVPPPVEAARAPEPGEPVAPPSNPFIGPDGKFRVPSPDEKEAFRAAGGRLASEQNGTNEQEVTAPSGQKVRTRFEVVDAGALRKAEGELQNRDRSRDSTDLQVTDIVSRFDPTRLGPSAESDRGAPIIGPDGIIESGNGRTMAIERVFAEHPDKAAAYRAYIESLGYDTTGIERPVLVRRRLTEMTPEERRAWIVGSNKDTKLELSPAERARSDADSITPEMLAKYAGGDLNSTGNAGFVEQFNKGLTVGEMNNMIGSDRRLTPVGQQRIENAIVARAYENPAILEKMMESANNEIRSITGSMADVAADWSRLRNDVKAGDVGGRYDITGDLVKAARRVADARAAGTKPYDILAQMDFADPIGAVEAELIRAFYNKDLTRAASRKAVTEALRQYTQLAREARATPGLFGVEDALPPEGILQQILAERDGQGQGDLLAAAEDRSALYDTEGKARRDEGGDQGPAQEARKGREVGSRREQGNADEGTGSGRGEGDAGLRTAEGAGLREVEDRSGIEAPEKGKYRDTFDEASYTNRRSIHDAAIRATGYSKEQFETLPPNRQNKLLKDELEKRYAIKVDLKPDLPLRLATDQILDAYQTLAGMAQVLGLPEQAIGFHGKLTLTLQSKGKFLGSYLPGDHVITLPGRSNSFGHEWGHALDYHVGTMIAGDVKSMSALVRGGEAYDMPGAVTDAYVNLMRVLFHDRAAEAAKIAELERKIASTKSDKSREAFQKQLDNILKGAGMSSQTRSQFYKGALALENKAVEYWTKPTEMLARSWEAYVAYRMEMAGFSNEFVTKGDSLYQSSAEKRTALSFPKGIDRAQAFIAYDELLEQLRQSEMLKGPDLAHDPQIASDLAQLEGGDRLLDYLHMQAPAQSRKARLLFGAADWESLQAWWHNLRVDRAKAAQHSMGWRKELGALANRANNLRNYIFSAMNDTVRGIAYRWKSEAMHELADHFGFDSTGKRSVGRVWHRAIDMQINKLTLGLEQALDSSRFVGGKGPATWVKKLTLDEEKSLRRIIEKGAGAGDDQDLVRIAAAIREMSDQAWYALRNALIADGKKEIGYIEDRGYIHDRYSLPKILKNLPEFTEAVRANYDENFDREFDLKKLLSGDQDALDDLVEELAKFKALTVKSLRAAMRAGNVPDGLIQQALDELRPMWVGVRTDAHVRATISGRDFAGTSPGKTDANSTKPRIFKGKARDLLAPFYISNPIEAAIDYVGSATRRTEWIKRFGADDAKLKALQDRMTAEGVPAYDQDYVVTLFDKMTGRYRRQGLLANQTFLNIVSFMKMRSAISMLGRAVTVSMPEALAEGVVTGNAVRGMTALARSYSTMLQTQGGRERMRWARTQGILTSHLMQSFIFQDRWGHATGTSLTRWDKIAMAAINKTGLGYITEAQIASAARVGGHMQLLDLAEDFLAVSGSPASREAARRFNELGISDHETFAKQMIKFGTDLPPEDWYETAMGYEYITAVDRFSKLVIAEPTPADKPAVASNPLASYTTHSITTFMLQSYRNLTKRTLQIALSKYKDADTWYGGALRGGAWLAAVFAGWVAMLMGQMVWTSGREEVMNRKRVQEWRDKDEYWTKMLEYSAQRSAALGWGDKPVNMYTGLQWNRPWYLDLFGAYAGQDLTNIQQIAFDPAFKNSKKTNTAEYNRVKASYNYFVAPAIGYAAGVAPGGMYLSPLAGAAEAFGTSRTMSDLAAEALEGPKGMKTDPETGELAETPEEYADRMAAKKERARLRAEKKAAGE